MEQHYVKISTNKTTVPLKVVPGHFATNHSHINYYIDMTTLKTRQADAAEIGKALAQEYINTTVVDTIVCVDGTEVVGAFLAQKLTEAGLLSINQHHTIYVITPEYNSNGQLIFRDNLQPMLRGKHVLLLMASVTTGKTINRCAECVNYYGGTVNGIASIFSAVKSFDSIKVNSIFTLADLPEYRTYSYRDCPHCKQGKSLDAIVNSYGYSKL